MKTLLLISGSEVRIWEVENLEDAKYQLQRRIEKEGFEADRAYLINESAQLPAAQWVQEYYDKVKKFEKEENERPELLQYERLKRKFESEET